MSKQQLAVVVAIGVAISAVWLAIRTFATKPISAAHHAEDGTTAGGERQAAAARRGGEVGESPVRRARVNAWQALLERVRQARQRRAAAARPAATNTAPEAGAATAATAAARSPGSASATPDSETARVLDKDTIKAAMREILPLVKECYGLAKGRDGAAPSGKLVVTFRIEGEADVGGVTSESAIDEARSTIAAPELRECVQESIHALQLPPPKHGGVVKVTYPFVFATGR